LSCSLNLSISGVDMRARWSRLIAAVAVVVGIAVSAGCVVFTPASTTIAQQQTVGSVQLGFTICASGTVAGSCADKGASGSNAVPGTGQVQVGIQVPANVGLPATFTSTGPEALVFSDSPSYAAELQRLAPAPAGQRWAGYLSAVTNYSTNGPQSAPVTLSLTLGQGADGSPFVGPLSPTIVLGGRQVIAESPGTRPVTCGGATLADLFVENPNTPAATLNTCGDATTTAPPTTTRDLGILSAGATASGAAGSLASIPFTLRYAGTATATANFALAATTSLPNATVAVTPGAFTPSSNSDSQALVAVGIPAGARAGTYDVTLTAKLANGQTRTRTGKLTVTGGGGGGGTTGGGTVKLKLTTVLPRGLSVVAARRSGIAVLIGANKGGTARVQLFQGTGKKNKRPKASKSVRLRVPGPTRVVLKSAKLRVGPYRVVITAGGRAFVRRAVLKK
jgi:hypothetical protein